MTDTSRPVHLVIFSALVLVTLSGLLPSVPADAAAPSVAGTPIDLTPSLVIPPRSAVDAVPAPPLRFLLNAPDAVSATIRRDVAGGVVDSSAPRAGSGWRSRTSLLRFGVLVIVLAGVCAAVLHARAEARSARARRRLPLRRYPTPGFASESRSVVLGPPVPDEPRAAALLEKARS